VCRVAFDTDKLPCTKTACTEKPFPELKEQGWSCYSCAMDYDQTTWESSPQLQEEEAESDLANLEKELDEVDKQMKALEGKTGEEDKKKLEGLKQSREGIQKRIEEKVKENEELDKKADESKPGKVDDKALQDKLTKVKTDLKVAQSAYRKKQVELLLKWGWYKLMGGGDAERAKLKELKDKKDALRKEKQELSLKLFGACKPGFHKETKKLLLMDVGTKAIVHFAGGKDAKLTRRTIPSRDVALVRRLGGAAAVMGARRHRNYRSSSSSVSHSSGDSFSPIQLLLMFTIGLPVTIIVGIVIGIGKLVDLAMEAHATRKAAKKLW
jgi:hypothetical protein